MTHRETPAAAWHGVLLGVVLTLVGMPVELLIAREVPGIPLWPATSCALGAVVLLAGVLSWRRKRGATAAGVLFLLNAVLLTVYMWIASTYYAYAPRPWMPFQANKLAVLAAAWIAPNVLAAGIVTIILFSGSALVRFYSFDPAVRERLPIGEPWALLAFTIFAILLLDYRRRRERVERELAQTVAETRAMQELARRFLAVRDMANTPLQSLEFDVSIVSRIPEARAVADRMRRSLARLRDWQHLMTLSDAGLEDSTRESFDARSVLDDTAVELAQRPRRQGRSPPPATRRNDPS